ncbi:MAG: TIGR03936 family radical SAM-associated protein, partial [Armatimonadota bacterium]|nr:TIGR03936 family radical SAM-associated protein [Armatimonadota bacterium]
KEEMSNLERHPITTQSPPLHRYRIMLRLKKGDSVKYIGHLDMLRAFEMALRRARIPLAYSAGFNPRPRMSFGSAIGVGVTSDDERIVLELSRPEPAEKIQERLNCQLPAGLKVLSAEEIPEEIKSPLAKLNVSVFRIIAKYQEAHESLCAGDLLEKMLSSSELRVSRARANKNKDVDIRPYILSADVIECSQNLIEFEISLRTNSSGGVSPRDFIEAARLFFPGLEVKNIHRLKQTCEDERR